MYPHKMEILTYDGLKMRVEPEDLRAISPKSPNADNASLASSNACRAECAQEDFASFLREDFEPHIVDKCGAPHLSTNVELRKYFHKAAKSQPTLKDKRLHAAPGTIGTMLGAGLCRVM